MPALEIPVKDSRKEEELTVRISAAAADFLKHLSAQKQADPSYVLNHLLLAYRDSLPVSQRGEKSGDKTDPKPELKKAASA